MATATQPQTKLMTAEEFMAADLGDGTFELVRGEVIEVPPAMPEHGRVCVNTCFALETYGRQSGRGYALSNDSGVQTEHDPDTVRGADVCFYSHARWPLSQVGRELIPVPPDLAVEVVSPGDRRGAILEKVLEYLRAGVLMVWVIYPRRRQVAVYRRDDDEPIFYREGDVLEGFPELPDFRCPVADLFPPAPPQ
jgi:Uma2 family endonuclease